MKTPTYTVFPKTMSITSLTMADGTVHDFKGPMDAALVIDERSPNGARTCVFVPGGARIAKRIAKSLNRNPGGLDIPEESRAGDPHTPRIYATITGFPGVQDGRTKHVIDVTTEVVIMRGCVGKICQDGAIFREEDIVPLMIDRAMREGNIAPLGWGCVGNVSMTGNDFEAWQNARKEREGATWDGSRPEAHATESEVL